jgi:hypothetical protein
MVVVTVQGALLVSISHVLQASVSPRDKAITNRADNQFWHVLNETHANKLMVPGRRSGVSFANGRAEGADMSLCELNGGRAKCYVVHPRLV